MFQRYMIRSLLTQSFNIVYTPIILLFSKQWVLGFAAEDNINDYNILGKGSYGMVFPGRHSTKDQEVVGKRYLFEKDLPTDEVDKEVDIMLKLLKHDNVLKGLDYVKKPTPGKYIHIWLILEFCSLGTLGD